MKSEILAGNDGGEDRRACQAKEQPKGKAWNGKELEPVEQLEGGSGWRTERRRMA